MAHSQCRYQACLFVSTNKLNPYWAPQLLSPCMQTVQGSTINLWHITVMTGVYISEETMVR